VAIDHDQIESILSSLESALGASESHGLLCGLLCSLATQRAKARWFSELLDSAGLQAGQVQSQAAAFVQLDQLFEESLSGINAADFAFELLLPDDTDDVVQRVTALASWCGGFCAGVGFGVDAQRTLPEDTQELIQDFTAISNADPEDSEDDEYALTELLEYVRMGVILVNEELQPAADVGASVH